MAYSELFSSYDEEYNMLSVSISQKLNTQLPTEVGEARKTIIRTIDREIEEADEILGKMEMEIHSQDASTRESLKQRLKSYRNDLRTLKSSLTKLRQTPNAREELLGRYQSSDNDTANMDQRARLLSGTERLNESSRRLQDSHRLALETESLGVGILSDLRSQREQIIHTRDTLTEADSYIDKAQRTLKGMARRMAMNQLLTAAIILMLLALIALVIYIKFG